VNAWSERDAADLARLGQKAIRILQKPFPSQELFEAIRQLTEEPGFEKTLTA
jgi:hypothetical protein